MGKLVNKKELSEILDISERTLTEYQKQGMPLLLDAKRGEANQYNTGAVIKWLIEKTVNSKVESARERLDRVRADREELLFAKDLGELVPADGVEEIWASAVIGARQTLLQSSAKLKGEIDALYNIDVDLDVLHEHTREVLIQLSGNGVDPHAEIAERA